MTQLTANGIAIEYERYGADHDETIVLVRGLGTQLIDWPLSFLETLVDHGFQVIIFDNRDAGLSEKFEGRPAYTLGDMAGDIVALMDGLGIGRAHVFGISMGGMIAQVLAAGHPDRLLSLTSVMSSSGRKGLPGPTPAAAAALTRETPATASEDDIIAATADDMAVFGSPGYPLDAGERLRLAGERIRRSYCPGGVRRQMAAVIASGSRVELLKGITVPTLVIHGADDPLVPLAAGEDTAACIPGARLVVIPGMGHDLPPALVPTIAGLLVDFCQDVTGAPS